MALGWAGRGGSSGIALAHPGREGRGGWVPKEKGVLPVRNLVISEAGGGFMGVGYIARAIVAGLNAWRASIVGGAA